MITVARNLRTFTALAIVLSACSPQLPMTTAPSSAVPPAPQVDTARPFQGQAAPTFVADPQAPQVQQSATSSPDPIDALRRGGKRPKPNPSNYPAPPKGGGDYRRPNPKPTKAPKKDGRPKPRPDQRPKPTPTAYPNPSYPDRRYDPNPRYRNPDYGYLPPEHRYQDDVRVTRTWTDDVSADSLTVYWTTNVAARGMVAWRKDGERQYSPWQYPADVFHSYTIRDLEPDTTYWYRVVVRTDAGATVSSPEMSVRTEPAATVTPSPDTPETPDA